MMPVHTSDSLIPKKNSLVVCAGTITCYKVSDMGSGFVLFKDLFEGGLSCNTPGKTWEEELQVYLDSYFNEKKPMPSYVRVAQQKKGAFIGGVATVPVKGHLGVNHPEEKPSEIEEESQYKLAIINSINDARALKRPLFLQPLGIGVYGWDSKKAATLFAESIILADPNNEIDITIPIYNQSAHSADQVFKETFNQVMTKMLKEELSKKEEPKKEESKKEKPKKKKPKKEKPKKEKFSNKKILMAIVQELINNIENKAGTRKTSWNSASKIKILKQIQDSIKSEKKLDSDSDQYQDYIQKIMEACKIKRNPVHFWKKPDSVEEYKKLLEKHKILYSPKPNLKSNN
jgi:hypothetical protein